MSDESNAAQVPAAGATEATGKKSGFLSTPVGKVVAIVVGLSVLGVIAGIAVAIVLFVFGSQAVDELESQIDQAVNQPPVTQESTAAAAPVGPAAEIPNSSVFTFRDIFVPLVRPVASATTTSTTTASDTVTPTTSDTLYLDGVVTQDGVLMAQLRYNSQSYTLAAGGVIPNTPWEVLRVSTSSVTMLFGDVQVTLSVGQGIRK